MFSFTAGFLSLVLADVNSNLTPSSAALAFVAGEVIVYVSPTASAWVAEYRTPLMIGAGSTMAVHYFGAFSQAASLGVGIAVGIAAYAFFGGSSDSTSAGGSTFPFVGSKFGLNRFNDFGRTQTDSNASRMTRHPRYHAGSGMPGPLFL